MAEFNAVAGTKVRPNEMQKQDSLVIAGTTLGFFIDLFRNFPGNIPDACYRVLCAIAGVLIIAPVLIHAAGWAAKSFSWLSWLDTSAETPFVPLIYMLCTMFAEPMITFIAKVFEVDLPRIWKKRINDRTKTNK